MRQSCTRTQEKQSRAPKAITPMNHKGTAQRTSFAENLETNPPVMFSTFTGVLHVGRGLFKESLVGETSTGFTGEESEGSGGGTGALVSTRGSIVVTRKGFARTTKVIKSAATHASIDPQATA
jgi:hypothetical protein